MSLKFEIIRKTQVLVSEWSGGKTSELVIYPKTSEYRKRNFQFRISTAVIEQETSDFTILPGIERILMMLDGTIRIEHPGHMTCLLEPFQPHSFSGNWITKSYGMGKDFNLMLSDTCRGNLAVLMIEKQKKITYRMEKCNNNLHFTHLYSDDSTVLLRISDQIMHLEPGDGILISGNDNDDIRIENPANTVSHLIVSEITVH
jgi:environmental stress-induced protein Ves